MRKRQTISTDKQRKIHGEKKEYIEEHRDELNAYRVKYYHAHKDDPIAKAKKAEQNCQNYLRHKQKKEAAKETQ